MSLELDVSKICKIAYSESCLNHTDKMYQLTDKNKELIMFAFIIVSKKRSGSKEAKFINHILAWWLESVSFHDFTGEILKDI